MPSTANICSDHIIVCVYVWHTSMLVLMRGHTNQCIQLHRCVCHTQCLQGPSPIRVIRLYAVLIVHILPPYSKPCECDSTVMLAVAQLGGKALVAKLEKGGEEEKRRYCAKSELPCLCTWRLWLTHS